MIDFYLTHSLCPLVPADRTSNERSCEVRKSSFGDASQPIAFTAGLINLRMKFFKPSEISGSSEKTDLTVPREPKICDQTRKFVSFVKPSVKASKPGVAASPDIANAPASPIKPTISQHITSTE